jgi:hypothetical protein
MDSVGGITSGRTMKRKSVPLLWMGVAFGVALVMAAADLAVIGTDVDSIGEALRLAARWSFVVFWMAYVAGPMAVLFGPAFAPLARRGREFGLAFASAHLVHLGLVAWLYVILHHAPLSGGLLVFFMIGIFWTYLLAVLSFGGLARALGPMGWRLVRVLGMNYILIAFGYDFVLSVVHNGIAHQGIKYLVEYVPFAAMSVAAPLLLIAAMVRRQWGVRHAAA